MIQGDFSRVQSRARAPFARIDGDLGQFRRWARFRQAGLEAREQWHVEAFARYFQHGFDPTCCRAGLNAVGAREAGYLTAAAGLVLGLGLRLGEGWGWGSG